MFLLAATGVAVQVFKASNINYLFIFEVDQQYRLIHHQFYRLSMVFGCIWLTCLVWQLLEIKLVSLFPWDFPIFTIILIVAFTLLCCLPFHVCYLKGRLEVLRTLGNILISPFGLVRFRHFFMADIITSMTHCLTDTATIGCYFATGKVKTSSEVEDLKGEC